jgi:hypothetical protein
MLDLRDRRSIMMSDGGAGPLLEHWETIMSWVEMNREILKACVQHDRVREQHLYHLALRMSLELRKAGQVGAPGTTIVH